MKLQQTIDNLNEINRQRTLRTQDWANKIEEMSNGKISTVVNANSDISEISEAIDIVASKTGSQEATRSKGIEEVFGAAQPKDAIGRLQQECLSLLYWCQIGSTSGEERPKCPELTNVIGDTEKIRAALMDRIDTARVEAISVAVPKPQITLYYCDGDRKIPFEKASEGQRAAALLFLLLEQPGGPLIIDQPEGDLDNKIIADLTEKLHSAKHNRQIIFVSHNANIVVNGSSELVVQLDIDDGGDRKIACAGAIDEPRICSIITATMEGGEKAFTDRKNKYGY